MTAETTIPDEDGSAAGCRERADREATDWLILLQEDADAADVRRQFDVWIASAVNAAAWAETRHVVSVIEATPPNLRAFWPDDRGASSPASKGTTSAHRRRVARIATVSGKRWDRRVVAAVIATAACMAIAAGPEAWIRVRADHVTGVGEIRSVRLADGSRVEIAPAGAVAVAYSGGKREVRLLKGEAYFEVVRDPSRPFRVVAGDVDTTVLGTGFEVRLRPDGAEVAVRHGLVRVDRDSARTPVSARLSAGDQIRVMSKAALRSATSPDKVATWIQGRLVVTDRPVSEVIDALRPWYGGVIVATGARLRSERVTGVYDLSDPAAALAALGQAHNASVHRVSPWIVLISAK